MKKFVERNLYVDDALTSLPSAKGAIDLARRTQQALSAGGNLKLHTVVSNSSEDMAAFPREYIVKDLRGLDFAYYSASLQRSLGMSWNIRNDALTFCVIRLNTTETRTVLSAVSSLFDSLGLAAPVTGKPFLRELTDSWHKWDESLSEDFIVRSRSASLLHEELSTRHKTRASHFCRRFRESYCSLCFPVWSWVKPKYPRNMPLLCQN